MKRIFIIAIICITIGSVFLLVKLNKKGLDPGAVSPPSPSIIPTHPPKSTTQSVPLPMDSRVIVRFFTLIQERKIPEAVMLMGKEITGDDVSKQAWGTQLSSMKSVRIVLLEPHLFGEWKETQHKYKIILDVSMDSASSGAPIPYYGWEKGKNTRWITLSKENNAWKITEIATGP